MNDDLESNELYVFDYDKSEYKGIQFYEYLSNLTNVDDCIACGTCIGECPVEAISEGEKYSINPDLCTECGTCASVCPQEAISLGE